MAAEYVLVLIKPGAIKRGLAGEIINRYERSGLKIERMSLKKYPCPLISELYKEHEGKEFYDELVETICHHKIAALVLAGPEGAVKKVRRINGATDPKEAAPGTIRGDFGLIMGPDNVVHGSDSLESAKREISIFFPQFIAEKE